MTNEQILQRVLEKYKFEKPLPPEVRRDMTAMKKSTLRVILKKNRKYNLFVLLVISVYFSAKKFGAGLSFAKSITVAAALSLIAAGAVIVGSYFAVTSVMLKKPQSGHELHGLMEKGAVNTERIIIPGSNKEQGVRKPLIGLSPFKFSGDDGPLAGQLAKSIAAELRKIRSGENAEIIEGPDAGKAGSMIIGSLVAVEGGHMLTVRLVDSHTSRILMYISENIESGHDINPAARNIASRISAAVK